MKTPPIEPKKKMSANEPCWCGSGKKYKKCHRDKESKPRVNPFDLRKEALSAFKDEYCSHPSASKENCDHIIKAHTITKGFALASIAEEGHVYSIMGTVDATSENMRLNNGKIIPQKTGVNLASTFTGFCSKHDNELFEPIEQGIIDFNCKSIFLLSYRTACLEFFRKKAAMHINDVLRDEGDNGCSFQEQMRFQSEMNELIHYTDMGFRETELMKEKYDEVLINDDFSRFKFVAVRLNQTLPVVSSGGRFLNYDFFGTPLFDREKNYDDPPYISVNIINDNKESVALIAWFCDDERLEKFAESFIERVSSDGANFLVQFGIATFENTHCRPSWWEGLEEKTRQTLCDAIESDILGSTLHWHEAMSKQIDLNLEGCVLEIASSLEDLGASARR